MTLDTKEIIGHFGPYGGRFVPEALIGALEELEAALGVKWASKPAVKPATEKRTVAAKKPAVRKPATAKVGAGKPVKAPED